MTKSILFEIDAEIARLRQAKALLSSAGTTAIKRKPGRPSKTAAIVVPVAQKAKKRKKMSAEGRERVRQAQIMRWAAARQAAKTTAAPLSKSKKKVEKAAAYQAASVWSEDSTQQSCQWELLMSRICRLCRQEPGSWSSLVFAERIGDFASF